MNDEARSVLPRGVRRTVRRQRRVGAGAVLIAAASALTAACGSGSIHRTSPATPQPPGVRVQARLGGAVQLEADHAPAAKRDAGATAGVVHAEQALTLRLLDKVGAKGNASLSPLSLYLALGMLRNGAAGTTEKQIATALQAGDLPIATQNAGLSELMTELRQSAAKDAISLDSANSIWTQRGFKVRTQFLADLATYYKTGLWQVDFRTPAGAEAIDTWTAQQTRGKITKLFDELPRDTLLVLANAIYFHAAWMTPFDPDRTEPGGFTTGDGAQVTTKFMSGRAGLQTKITGDYEAVQLPYRGGRFVALAVMPKHGPLNDFVAGLSPDGLRQLTAGMSTGSAPVSLPRFTTTSTSPLESTLRVLGMTQVFTDSADLSKLSDTRTKVDQIVQRVYLGVGEKGTTAAAATGVSLRPTSAVAGPDVRLDHPFLFLVRDTQTGAVLFASKITNPAAG
ncbi:MAG: serpin family protein [Jatrophihabitans sp.]